MQKRREELVRKNEWYKWFRHLVDSGGVVEDRYVIEDGRNVLYLKIALTSMSYFAIGYLVEAE